MDQKEYQRLYYLNNKVERKRIAWEGNKRFKARNKKYVKEYLEQHPCVDCGEADPIVLEFDHVRGEKRDHISSLVSKSCSIEVIQEEIGKCEVRCANCHRKVTYYRRLERSSIGQSTELILQG